MAKLAIVSMLVVISVICVSIGKIVREHQQKQKTKTYKIFHMKYGGAYCEDFSPSNCGVHLLNCTDGKNYYCMHDVSMEMDK